MCGSRSTTQSRRRLGASVRASNTADVPLTLRRPLSFCQHGIRQPIPISTPSGPDRVFFATRPPPAAALKLPPSTKRFALLPTVHVCVVLPVPGPMSMFDQSVTFFVWFVLAPVSSKLESVNAENVRSPLVLVTVTPAEVPKPPIVFTPPSTAVD